jgi:hypothetical protein
MLVSYIVFVVNDAITLVGAKFLSEFPESRLEVAPFHHLGSPESQLEATPTLIYRSFSFVGTMETRFDRRIRDGLLDIHVKK